MSSRTLLITYNTILLEYVFVEKVLLMRQEVNTFLWFFPSDLSFLLLGALLKQDLH